MVDKTSRSHWIPTAFMAAAAFVIGGCSDPGPAEEAGERFDDAMEDVGDSFEDARRSVEDTIDPPGPGERAGRAMDDAVDEARDAVEN